MLYGDAGRLTMPDLRSRQASSIKGLEPTCLASGRSVQAFAEARGMRLVLRVGGHIVEHVAGLRLCDQ